MDGLHAIDLNLLVAFDALMRERHVTRAGRALGLSQSAMSGALTRLRRLTRDELFVRAPGGMLPTPRAQELAGPIGRALGEVAGVFDLARPTLFDPAGADRAFVIGLADDATAVLLPALLAHLAGAAPRVTVRVRRIWARSLIDLLDGGEIDLGVGALRAGAVPARIVGEPVFRQRFVSVLRRGHPDAERLDLAAFVRLPHLLVHVEGDAVGAVDRVLAERGLKRRVAVTVPGFLEALSVVAATDLIATLPERVVRRAENLGGGLTALEPPLPVPGFEVAQFWHRRAEASAAHRWLRETTRALAVAL